MLELFFMSSHTGHGLGRYNNVRFLKVMRFYIKRIHKSPPIKINFYNLRRLIREQEREVRKVNKYLSVFRILSHYPLRDSRRKLLLSIASSSFIL